MTRGARWLSPDPSKAWAERFFLLYSPVWIAAVALVQLPLGDREPFMASWGDPAYLAFGISVALPLWLVPLLRRGEADRGRPWWDAHWLRFNVWIAVFTWVGSYFITHYFFRVMGMAYAFPVEWTLDAEIGGEVGTSEVPLFLYPLTHAYFVTYHTVLVVALRKVRAVLTPGPAGTAVAVFLLSYGVAFAETFAMANPLLERWFGYADLGRMLVLGSAGYALMFCVSLPLIARLDEPRPWPLRRVLIEALGASMAALILLDAWALIIGPIG